MRRYADAAAHDNPVHNSDIGLGIARNISVHNIFVAPETRRQVFTLQLRFVDRADITARAKPAISCAGHQNGFDSIVFGKTLQSLMYVLHHFIGKRIQRLGTIERDASQ